MNDFLASDAATALRRDLLRDALAGTPTEADAASVLLGAAGQVLEASFGPEGAAEIIIGAGRMTLAIHREKQAARSGAGPS